MALLTKRAPVFRYLAGHFALEVLTKSQIGLDHLHPMTLSVFCLAVQLGLTYRYDSVLFALLVFKLRPSEFIHTIHFPHCESNFLEPVDMTKADDEMRL